MGVPMDEAEVTNCRSRRKTFDIASVSLIHSTKCCLMYRWDEGMINQNLKQSDAHLSRILKLKKVATFASMCKTYASFRKTQTNTLPMSACSRGQLKCDGTRAEIRFSLLAKRTSPFKSAGASVQSTTCSRVVRISGSNAGYTMFRRSVKCTAYPHHSPVSPSFLSPPPCVTVCHHIATGLCQGVSGIFR